MGLGAHFPWPTVEAVLDHRCSPMGKTFSAFASERYMALEVPRYRSYRERGFATPSGKVELRSSILEALGFDPLPYHREPPRVSDEFPLTIFIGVREDPYFQTGQRNIGVLRRRSPQPRTFLHPDDAICIGVVDGDWVKIESAHGSIVAEVEIRDTMKLGHVRVPHGWWFPEIAPETGLSGAFVCNDGMLVADSPEYLDAEQGVPHFKGFPGRVIRLESAPDLSELARRS
jgi:anaerobic selenocysteine-containing dehydrogenase